MREEWCDRVSPDSGFSDSERAAGGAGGVLHWDEADPFAGPAPPIHASTPKKQPADQPQTNSSVNLWLKEVRLNCEPECMATLQSKSLILDVSEKVSILTLVTSASVKLLSQKTKLISSQFGDLYRLINYRKYAEILNLMDGIRRNMNNILNEYSDCENQMEKTTSGLEGALILLNNAIKQEEISKIKSSTKALATAFLQRVDHILLYHIKRLVGLLENTKCHASLMCLLSGLASLGLEASHLADLLARCSGITSLLALCINTHSVPVRSATLRMLTTVCCTPSSIMQFERGGGIEIICDILSDKTRGEAEQCEAASVIAQVTAPWLEHGHTVHNLNYYLPPIVSTLTRLVENTSSREMLLVCAAALANISWAEPRSVWPLLECSTVGLLLKAVRSQGPKACVFLKEQAATLLANMSAVAEVRPHLTQNRAVPALLCFLQVSHSPLQSQAELSAAYRVQHKSAIALSRLCSEPEVSHQVVQLQGICNLARLCKDEKERNNSDGVLVACLAALRKIVANCGRQVIDELNAKELVDPKLLESFLLYSSRQESIT